jgi:hypothetical protein
MFKGKILKALKSECMLVIILNVQIELSQRVFDRMTKEIIEFELSKG